MLSTYDNCCSCKTCENLAKAARRDSEIAPTGKLNVPKLSTILIDFILIFHYNFSGILFLAEISTIDNPEP